MTTDAPESVDVIQAALASALGKMRVIGVGTAAGYSPKVQSVTVQPVMEFRRYDDLLEEVIPYTPAATGNVPVLHPSAGGFFSAMPVKDGDFGVYIVCDRSHDEWKSTGRGMSTPQDHRRFDIQDSLFLPVGASFAQPVKNVDKRNQNWVFGEDSPAGFRFELGKGKLELGTPTVRVLKQLSDALLAAQKTASLTATSTVTTVFGMSFLSNAGQLATQAVNLAQARARIDQIRGK